MDKYQRMGMWTLILIGIVLSGTFMFSVIGEADKPSCDILTDGGTCSIEITLPENRGLSLYNVNLDFDAVPDEEFKGESEVSSFANGVYSYEPYDDNDVTLYMNLYRIPSDWGVPYEIRMTSKTMASTSVTNDDAFSKIEIVNGVVVVGYPYNSIEICKKKDDESRVNGIIET